MKQVSEKTINYQASVSLPAVFETGRFSSLVFSLSRFLDRIAAFCIVITMLLVVANVIMRVLFNKPILGTMEFVGFFTAVAVGLALAMCAVGKGHIAVDLLVDRLKPKARFLIDTMVYLLTVIFLGACGWGLVLYGADSAARGLVSPTTQTPVHLFIYLVALGFFTYALVQLVKLMDCLGKGGRGHE
ncbi:MAG: TRAP transporter small permease [Clostridia bacterium]|nr:TRAP transporter small permease [Clostridia bacterium]